LDKEYKITSTKSTNSVGTSPIAEVKCTERSPLRRVLSPINANGNQIRHEEVACKCPVQFEPKTPSTATCAKEKFVTISTPLEKFNAMSSSLKVK
jgi:kinesin family protein 22